ncbi:ATP-dependent helicase [Virgibacillus phasianinus]|uniref:ATP-dependent helicase n=1 Tax=Virgibacillus phasianinus TaxID=2017483 RepID=A0A220U5G6_9BACI|nr:SNF2-related protein [Virgibacillus phasianinus]ASK63212.1 ATP-dependent helicase [Virgibacillus phasianinus]
MDSIHIEKDKAFINDLQHTMEQNGPFSTWDLFQMAYQAELTTMTPTFNELRALEYVPHVNFLSHQLECAKQVIEQMNGRAILADEVGLGKTIEAGLILKEYMVRGLIQKVLILVPASLVNQWVQELNEKFYIPAVSFRKNYAWDQCDIIVSSIDTAKRDPHREQIADLNFDFILIDEAHKLKNHKTQNYEFVRSLKKKYCLLLTATPVQNKLSDIFNLVSILKPGYLGNYEEFLQRYGTDRKKIKQDSYLKQLIQHVMVRNTRTNTELNTVKRHIKTIWVSFSDEERTVYDQLHGLSAELPGFTKITLQRELCSSREACYLSMKKMQTKSPDLPAFDPLLTEIEQLQGHSKALKLVELLKDIGDEKVIIFTEYRSTQLFLQWTLQQHGITSVPFRGGFKKGKKDWMKQLFQNHAQVLIATEAGGEGINLQFCHHLINYDLPWNPMRLEQRIGRIHRYGQENDVFIYNLAIKETVEEHIMSLLYEKINLFERVIGNLDAILAELNIKDMEDEIQAIFAESSSDGETRIKLNNLTSIIESTSESTDSKEQQYGN